MNSKCKICGNSANNKLYIIKERILNKGDEFEYIRCSKCGTLMLNHLMENMSEWYPLSYNPYAKTHLKESVLTTLRKKFIFEYILRRKSSSPQKDFQKLLELKNFDILLKRLYGTKLKKSARILDVGCANGHFLNLMYEMGWRKLDGLDLFAPQVINKKWNFICGDIFAIKNQKYDCIVMSHSFEHMFNPREVLKYTNGLLEENGICIISIPLVGGQAWKLFGKDCCQIDAPRHIFLFTPNTMKRLCEEAGFIVEKVLFDSNAGIFSFSRSYHETDLSYDEIARSNRNSDYIIKKYTKLSRDSNLQRKGDQAVFYLRKK